MNVNRNQERQRRTMEVLQGGKPAPNVRQVHEAAMKRLYRGNEIFELSKHALSCPICIEEEEARAR